MGRSKKLELTWIGKEERPQLEPRILVKDTKLSYHASARKANDLFDNCLIQGDNLLALKALEADFTAKIKCVFIDPPYNTGSAFEHYEDGLEHSVWLSLMRERLEIIKNLLSDSGSLWITIDDNEAHYLKVICDEIFGRRNFIANVIWQKVFAPKNSARHFSDDHDHILVYAKNAEIWRPNEMPRSDKLNAAYKNPDKDPRGVWTSGDLSARNYYGAGTYSITCPSGRIISGPPNGMYWRVSEKRFQEMNADGRIWWGTDGNNTPRIKRFLSEVKTGVVPQTLWLNSDVGNTQEAKKEVVAIFGSEHFMTPKPERLLQRVIHISTVPGDIVLDSFAGSGTTGAVAHKMGRRWIMVELGDHAVTRIVPRLRKVIDGSDTGGVTNSVGWKGGGGFRFCRLAPSLLERDRWGNWVISKEYDGAMLAEAMCKHMGFTYAPSQDPSEYWRHGCSSERDFIFVTTHALTHEMLGAISYDVGPERHLLICCKAYNSKHADSYRNLTLVRIPHAVLNNCEWDRDDYSLKIASLPQVDQHSDTRAADAAVRGPQSRVKTPDKGRPDLFDETAEAEG